MTDKLLLNPGAFIHLVRETDDDEFFLSDVDTSGFDQYNPMGLRFHDKVSCYEEDEYGVNDLYVLRDRHSTFWGVLMYRGLGKHDEHHEIFGISSEVKEAVHDEQAREALEEYPLELFELSRKKVYVYEAR